MWATMETCCLLAAPKSLMQELSMRSLQAVESHWGRVGPWAAMCATMVAWGGPPGQGFLVQAGALTMCATMEA